MTADAETDQTLVDRFRRALGGSPETRTALQVAHRKLLTAPTTLVTPNQEWAEAVAGAARFLTSHGLDEAHAVRPRITECPEDGLFVVEVPEPEVWWTEEEAPDG